MNVALLINDQGCSHDTFSLISESLVPQMRAAGDTVVLIRSRAGFSTPFRSLRHGAVCYSVGFWKSALHGALAALQLAWIFKKERIDLVHVHFNGLDLWGFSLYRFFRPLPYVLTMHCLIKRRFLRFGWRRTRVLRFLLRHAGMVTAVSEDLKKSLSDHFPEIAPKLRVIPNGVAEQGPRAEGESPSPPRFILAAGDLCFEKGIDLLLFAFHDFARHGPADVRLVVCGEDLTDGRAEDLARRLGLDARVELRGPCPHVLVLRLMRECLFFVSPSREESFGIAILEAMAAGKAVVAPRVGGVPEYLRHGVNGLLFEPGDALDLGAAIRRLAESPGLRRALGRRAPAAAAAFTWPAVSRSYQEVHGQVLAR